MPIFQKSHPFPFLPCMNLDDIMRIITMEPLRFCFSKFIKIDLDVILVFTSCHFSCTFVSRRPSLHASFSCSSTRTKHSPPYFPHNLQHVQKCSQIHASFTSIAIQVTLILLVFVSKRYRKRQNTSNATGAACTLSHQQVAPPTESTNRFVSFRFGSLFGIIHM